MNSNKESPSSSQSIDETREVAMKLFRILKDKKRKYQTKEPDIC